MPKYYEETLPENYVEVYYINAKDKKVGLLLTLGSLLLMIIPLAILLPIYFVNHDLSVYLDSYTSIYLLSACFIYIFYIVAHELVHGIVYKLYTKQKLTFGLSWSCAFCGVPNVYVYRKASILALMAPFTVFSILFLALILWLYFVNGILYILLSVLFSLHFGGCVGDLYMFFLYLFKYKDKTTLMRDTGPEQYIYQLEKKLLIVK